MSVSEHSQTQCSADASTGIDGSGPAMSLYNSVFSDMTTHASLPEPGPSYARLDNVSHKGLHDDEGELLCTQSPLQHGSESPFSHSDTSSFSEPGVLDLSSSPLVRSPTSSTSSCHHGDPGADEDVSLGPSDISNGDNEIDHDDLLCLQEDSQNSQSPNSASPLGSQSGLSPSWHSSSHISPPMLDEVEEGGSQWITPFHESALTDYQSPIEQTSSLSHENVDQVSSTHTESNIHDVYTNSTGHHDPEASSEDGISDDSDSDSTVGHDYQDDTTSDQPQNSSTTFNTGFSSNVAISETVHLEGENMPAQHSNSSEAGLLFGPIQAGSNILMDFDFESFLNQTDPMELDGVTLNVDVNIASPQQGVTAANNLTQTMLLPQIQIIPQQLLLNHPNLLFGIPQGNGDGFFAFATAIDDDSQEWPGPQQYGEYERNLSFADFCHLLSSKFRQDAKENSRFKIHPDHFEIVNSHLPAEVNQCDINEGEPDYQGIPWKKLEIDRQRCRTLRNEKYSNYANMKPYPEPQRIKQNIPANEHFFRFRKTCNTVDVRFSHFQLRNVVSAVSKNDVFYTEDSTVVRIDPQTNKKNVVMDFRKPYSGDPIKITSLASDYGVIIAGGFYGEYAIKSLDSQLKSKPVEGLVTTDSNGITNHVHFFKSRTGGTPMAVFSSNDEKLRTLDCYSNTMVSEFKLPWAINCSATSPDGRLRVIVGDASEVIIQGVDDGETIHSLPGHVDYGFACAWSDDGHTIATGNQDMMVRVYDARNFKREIAVLDADIAGARSLRFSPVGSGPRVLAWAEPADMVSIIDAITWESRQRIDFFGEIAGISFTPDGRELYIANSDRTVGGLMQFERWNGRGSGYPDEEGEYESFRHPIFRKGMRFRDVGMGYTGIL